MSQPNFDIDKFVTLTRMLIHKYDELKHENARLSELAVTKDDEIKRLKDEIAAQEAKYDNLMVARMLNITDGNIDETKKKVNDLIRTVNQCITLLNGK